MLTDPLSLLDTLPQVLTLKAQKFFTASCEMVLTLSMISLALYIVIYSIIKATTLSCFGLGSLGSRSPTLSGLAKEPSENSVRDCASRRVRESKDMHSVFNYCQSFTSDDHHAKTLVVSGQRLSKGDLTP